MTFWLGETVGIAFMSCVNPVAWIAAFVYSKQRNHFLYALIIGLVNAGCWILLLALLDDSTPGPVQMGMAAMLAGVGIFYAVILAKKIFSKSVAMAKQAKRIVGSVDTAEAMAKIKSEATGQISSFKRFNPDGYSDEVFEIALEELESDQPRKATWAKCLAISDGDLSKAKAKYIELRVKELSLIQ